MIIERVDVYSLAAKLEKPFGWSQRWTDHRGMTVVKLTTDDGIVGWGECGMGQAARAAVESLASLFTGEDALARERLWQKIADSLFQSHGYAGAGMSALSAFDIALWDIGGKAAGEPVCRLLGGPVRDSVAVYATGLYYTENDFPDALIAEAIGYREREFSGMKMKIAGKPVAEDVRRVFAVRKAIGNDLRLMVDANEGYNAATAIAVGRQIAAADIAWFEEPCGSYDDAANLQVKEGVEMPISGGEGLRTRYEFAPRLAGHVFDIVQPDVVNVGGITELLHVGQMANAFGVPMNPHFWGTGISFAASLHVSSCLPLTPHSVAPEPYVNEPVLEYDQTPHPVRQHLTSGFEVAGSRVAVPTGPGLGIEIDEGALDRFAERPPAAFTS
ncbi:MAG: mandelate racemase/muconate lactonizing enzyme family protein [Chloroflexi bacterium]|nr:mandelate racemase/muconate lactonizing enzyme family protein [Chloroflexota bacterium]